ncbi:hypothetical protein [Taibaiella soli]|nr:hypothetical protein [Taibaiella soli]
MNRFNSIPNESNLTNRKNIRSDGRLGWGQKIATALARQALPLSTEQLIDLLETDFPVAEKSTDRRVYYTTQIFHACKREWICLHYNSRRKGFYCLPEWYDENGNLPDRFYEIMNL